MVRPQEIQMTVRAGQLATKILKALDSKASDKFHDLHPGQKKHFARLVDGEAERRSISISDARSEAFKTFAQDVLRGAKFLAVEGYMPEPKLNQTQFEALIGRPGNHHSKVDDGRSWIFLSTIDEVSEYFTKFGIGEYAECEQFEDGDLLPDWHQVLVLIDGDQRALGVAWYDSCGNKVFRCDTKLIAKKEFEKLALDLEGFVVPRCILGTHPTDFLGDGEHYNNEGYVFQIENGRLHCERGPALKYPDFHSRSNDDPQCEFWENGRPSKKPRGYNLMNDTFNGEPFDPEMAAIEKKWGIR